MNRTLLATALVATTVASALAASPPSALLPAAPGARVHVHLVQTMQGANGPLATTTDFDLVRRGPSTLVIERPQPGSAPDVTVLSLNRDGSLALAEGASAAAADADATGLVQGLNAALAATRNADPATHGAWAATLPLAGPGTATATVSIVPATVTAGGFDFTGDGQTTAAAASPPSDRGGSGGGMRFPGGGGGGGFGGGGFGRSRRGGGDGGPGGPAQTVSMHVEGHYSGLHLDRVTIVQTRSILVGGMPFVNTESWVLTLR
jgi:uncharacterized membrane protein YgcG